MTILASKSIYNFLSDVMLIDFILQFLE